MSIKPEEIARRLAARECLHCGLSPLELDPDTGFPFHLCLYHRKQAEAAKEKKEPPSKYNKRVKEEGIENLDRLMGVSTKADAA